MSLRRIQIPIYHVYDLFITLTELSQILYPTCVSASLHICSSACQIRGFQGRHTSTAVTWTQYTWCQNTMCSEFRIFCVRIHPFFRDTPHLFHSLSPVAHKYLICLFPFTLLFASLLRISYQLLKRTLHPPLTPPSLAVTQLLETISD